MPPRILTALLPWINECTINTPGEKGEKDASRTPVVVGELAPAAVFSHTMVFAMVKGVRAL